MWSSEYYLSLAMPDPMIIYYDLLGYNSEEICDMFSTDNDKLFCENGDYAKKWNGCIEQGSKRLKCPLGYIACNDHADNGIEFKCEPDCTNHGGNKKCIL